MKETAPRSFRVDGQKLRELRLALALSQTDLAEKAGCSKNTISVAEKDGPVGLKIISAIAEVLQVAPTDISPVIAREMEPNEDALKEPQVSEPVPSELDVASVNGRADEAGARKLLAVWTTILCVAVLSLGGAFFTFRAKPADPALLNLFDGVWLSYNPTEFVAGELDRETKMPTRQSIAEDIAHLKNHTRVAGLISFGADGTMEKGLAAIPRVCKDYGLRSIMGVYIDPQRPENVDQQMQNALGEPGEHADGFILFYADKTNRSVSTIKPYLDRLQNTGKPVAVRLQVSEYLADTALLTLGDYIAMDIRPSWRDGSYPDKVAEVVLSETRDICQLRNETRFLGTVDKPVLIGLISYPSDGAPGLSETNQHDFFRRIIGDDDKFFVQRNVFSYYYDAFDPESKPKGQRSDAEAHRGLFTNNRQPKPAAKVFAHSLE